MRHLDRGGGGPEAREQAEDQRDAADEFDRQTAPDPEDRIEAHVGEGLDIGAGPARHLAPAVHGEIPAAGDADHRPGQRNDEIVERLELRQQQFRFGLRVGHDVPSPDFFGAMSTVAQCGARIPPRQADGIARPAATIVRHCGMQPTHASVPAARASLAAPGSFGRCALEKVRGRAGRREFERTHGPRHLATPKRNGDPAKDRRPFVAKPQVRRPPTSRARCLRLAPRDPRWAEFSEPLPLLRYDGAYPPL